MKDRLVSICFLLGLVAVICIFVYPNFMDALSNVKHISSLHAYDEGVSAIAGGEMDRSRKRRQRKALPMQGLR